VSSRLVIERLFPAPIYILETDDDALLAPIEAAVCNRQKEEPGVRRSNIGGWHSSSDFRTWSGEAGQALIQRVVDLASLRQQGGRSRLGRMSTVDQTLISFTGTGAHFGRQSIM